MENFSEFLDKNRDAREVRMVSHRPLPPLGFEEKVRMYFQKKEVKISVTVVLVAFAIAFYFGQRTNRPAKSSSTQIKSTISSQVSTSTTNPYPAIKVYVTGAVNKPGVYEVDSKARVGDVIELAGGFSSVASVTACNLAGFLIDGMALVVPSDREVNGSCGQMATDGPGAGSLSSPINPQGSKVSLNSGSQSELETLPGVGPSLAGAIINYRTQSGGFKSISDLRKVKGIGDKRFSDLKDLVTL